MIGATSGRRRGWGRQAAGVAACAAGLACARGPADAEAPGMRVLFVGNSLTYANELPEMARALAAAAGERLEVEMVAMPDWSLEDHWAGGGARAAIARGGWDVVVLQQGPSALPESRALLVDYAQRFAAEIREGDAEPALYAVWPSRARSGDFDRASESYRQAAAVTAGIHFPAGEAWRAAWAADPTIALYGPDAFHPSEAGTYLAALVIYGRLFNRSPAGLPNALRLRSGATVRIPSATATTLQHAAESVLVAAPVAARMR